MKKFLKNNKHWLYLLYLPIYLFMYMAVEQYVVDDYWVSYLPIDDKIPFNEYFVIGYISWYVFMVGVGIALLFKDTNAFRRYMIFIIIGFTSTIIFCLIFPNGQNLRPTVFENNNIFTKLVRFIYSADTNTNVLPSMHVIGSFAAMFAVFDSKETTFKFKGAKLFAVFLTIFISLATVFIKQHSMLDVYAGIIVSIILYLIVYGKNKMFEKENL